MGRYIDVKKLIALIDAKLEDLGMSGSVWVGRSVLKELKEDIKSLQQEQPDLPSGEEVMTMCNQILIDWVKEGKTQEEKEQREQAHSRFFELYDEYLLQEPSEVDLEREIDDWYNTMGFPVTADALKETARHFYELGCKAIKEE